ncbi:Uncharacterised protein [Klebsiella pneumoniae]|jgi:hypothetical protein|nr:Uncharacterised protein [Klebsiella pneumoniae]
MRSQKHLFSLVNVLILCAVVHLLAYILYVT